MERMLFQCLGIALKTMAGSYYTISFFIITVKSFYVSLLLLRNLYFCNYKKAIGKKMLIPK